ncbi:hypothetical protein [Achromobacter marplatensis]
MGAPTGYLASLGSLVLGTLKGAIEGGICVGGQSLGGLILHSPDADKLKWVAGAVPTVAGLGGCILLGHKFGEYLVEQPCMKGLPENRKANVKHLCGGLGGAAFAATLAIYKIGPSSVAMTFGVANITSVIANEAFSVVIGPLIPGLRSDNRSGAIVLAHAITDATFGGGMALTTNVPANATPSPLVLVTAGALNGLVGKILDGISGAREWEPSSHRHITTKKGWMMTAQKFAVQVSTSLAVKLLVPLSKLIPGDTAQKWINPPLGAIVSIPNSIRQSLANCLLVNSPYGFSARPAKGGILAPPAPLAALLNVQNQNPKFVRAYLLYEIQQLLIELGKSRLDGIDIHVPGEGGLPACSTIAERVQAGKAGKSTSVLGGLKEDHPWLSPRVETLLGRLLTKDEIETWADRLGRNQGTVEQLCGWLRHLAENVRDADEQHFESTPNATRQHERVSKMAQAHLAHLRDMGSTVADDEARMTYASLLELAQEDLRQASQWHPESNDPIAGSILENLQNTPHDLRRWFSEELLEMFEKADRNRNITLPPGNQRLPSHVARFVPNQRSLSEDASQHQSGQTPVADGIELQTMNA